MRPSQPESSESMNFFGVPARLRLTAGSKTATMNKESLIQRMGFLHISEREPEAPARNSLAGASGSPGYVHACGCGGDSSSSPPAGGCQAGLPCPSAPVCDCWGCDGFGSDH